MLFFIPLPRLSVVTFSLRYRVSDSVGGHLTGIMIADLPLEVVQFFCTLFCIRPLAVPAYCGANRPYFSVIFLSDAIYNQATCISILDKPVKCSRFVQ
jgi:hypothetical protein